LQQYEYDDDIISKIISKLYELNYLNDEDYTNSFLKEKMKLRPSGKILLKYELKNRGIDEKLIDNCLDEIGTNEFDMAFEICEKKFNNLKLFDQKEKQKIYSFLQRRGFNSNTIINVITKLKNIKDGKYEI